MSRFLTVIFILIALCLSMASSCRPDSPKQKYLGTYPLGDIKDYLYFKPGSMWVYECDSTGELDTQVLVSSDTPWYTESYIRVQSLRRVIKSLNEGSIYSDHPYDAGGIYYDPNYKYTWYTTRWRSNPKNNGSGTDCIFFKPYDTTLNGGFGSSPTKYKGLLNNYSVLGKTYDTVRVFQVKTGGTFPYCKIKTWESARITYFWAKGVGLIRLLVETNRKSGGSVNFNWNLKSYHLN